MVLRSVDKRGLRAWRQLSDVPGDDAMGSMQMAKMRDMMTAPDEEKAAETFANEPEEKVQDIDSLVNKHSGGLNTGQTVFSYDKNLRSVHIPVDIWRELSIMGRWIQDATLLRWAELTAKISNSTIRPSEIIDLLLFTVDPERDVNSARTFYKKITSNLLYVYFI